MARRWVLIFVAVVAVGPLPADDQKDKDADKKKAEAVKKERQRLQGSWQIVEFVSGGEPQPEEVVKAMRVTFKDDRMTMSLGKDKDAGLREYTFALDPTQTPKAIDTTPDPKKFKIKVAATPGIYQLDGDTLKLCLARLGSKVRPKEFESTAEAGTVLITLKRAKK